MSLRKIILSPEEKQEYLQRERPKSRLVGKIKCANLKVEAEYNATTRAMLQRTMAQDARISRRRRQILTNKSDLTPYEAMRRLELARREGVIYTAEFLNVQAGSSPEEQASKQRELAETEEMIRKRQKECRGKSVQKEGLSSEEQTWKEQDLVTRQQIKRQRQAARKKREIREKDVETSMFLPNPKQYKGRRIDNIEHVDLDSEQSILQNLKSESIEADPLDLSAEDVKIEVEYFHPAEAKTEPLDFRLVQI